MEGKVVGSEGKLGSEVAAGNGGMLRDGTVGIEGKGGNVVGFGKVGMVGKFGCVVVCKRWRASTLMFDIVTTRSKTMMKDLLEARHQIYSLAPTIHQAINGVKQILYHCSICCDNVKHVPRSSPSFANNHTTKFAYYSHFAKT
ncbi:hypothetical protein P8452_68636 [Trifolium repens]|nr:hypothetical protein QL285_042043 [Trifolium repens]WJX86312.1 hypothetical protein P8452_68636 [Trifolium repens]